ncbi:MAG TPA: exodeoxyribonuclease VII small subunit [Candidatus Poseidoniales archaeon]|nr:exodeoxyribonuclease VII small subunit [Euryarchaeota archaeon]DAC56051.1 MAG TPA: exodeoxyribonuclease VII small subunit [Candidatus Poseidoniales archaeon]HII27118.1 exodeoxyribonuclease VII small subunit [Poseidonia sp.]
MTYDEALRRLEELVTQLERGGRNLEETLAMFEEGTALLKRCQNELGEVEGRLAELRLDEAEALVKDDH